MSISFKTENHAFNYYFGNYYVYNSKNYISLYASESYTSNKIFAHERTFPL